MKFTHRWLLQHLSTGLSPQAIGERLTLAGLELEGLTDLRQGLERVQTGVLLEVLPHPNADRLTLCQVQVGGERLTIVCGATNHQVGDKVAVAREGACLPNGLTIRRSTVRGRLSEGMLCSPGELGLAGPADGILILPLDTADGLPLAELLGRDDHLFELSLTPNRGDCLGVRGIARELGALTQTPLLPLLVQPVQTDADPAVVQVDDAQGCPRYAGRVVRGVRIRPSPAWLRLRLEAVGLRSINNVVDVTNYVLLDLNQPLHAFDLARLHLPIQVRRARPGEVLRTLDGVERTLDGDMTVIADRERSLALAGIMGGEESGVTEATTDLFLEAAYFEPTRIARTGRHLGITSDSRHRFERGIDPEGLLPALSLATRLILELAGGEAGPVTWVDAGSWSPLPPVAMRPRRINRLGGIDLNAEAMTTMLGHLGCRMVGGDGDTLIFQPPSHRHDLRREEDLLEEVIRLYGYDRVQTSLPRPVIDAPATEPLERTTGTARRLLTGRGYLEVINYAFVSAELQQRFDPTVAATALLNPISAEQAVLRTSLTAGLVENGRRNLSRGTLSLRLFELGQVFLPTVTGRLEESQRLAGLLCGPLHGRNWHTPAREADFFDLKGDVEALLRSVGWTGVSFDAGGPAFLHPGRKAMIVSAGNLSLGWIGTLHPALQRQLDLPQPLQLFELEAAALVHAVHATVMPGMASRFPAVERDFAFVVEEALPSATLLAALAQVNPALIRTVTLFDLYAGSHLAAGWKSLAVRVVLQADDRTLTDPEVQSVAEEMVVQMNKQFGALLRG
ncbi:MAG: phenylalanine--tRNA ligase subunit beta [Magnetococcus sp. DMHC-8]